MLILSQKLKSLPQSPGVYIFYAKGVSAYGGKNKTGKILYVGKAGSLKDRVSSYFQNRNGYARPIEIFISEVKDLEIRKTDTVLEAYILEQSLIKKLQPKYNIDGKDDKSFCYVVVTKEEFPRFLVLRKTELINKLNSTRLPLHSTGETLHNDAQAIKVYGPYTSRRQIETVLKILRKIFPYHAKPQKTEKGCLDYQIGLCPGPYDGAILKVDYRKNIQAIKMILEGKKKGLLGKMKKEMEKFSNKHEYEKAANLRNKIFALQHIQDVALISDKKPHLGTLLNKERESIRIEGYDISNISGRHATGSMVVFDNSEGEIKPNKNEYRKFRIKTIESANDVGAMEEMLSRRFRNNWPKPNLIILDGGAGHLNMARRILRIYHLEIPLLSVAKGKTRKKLDFRSFGTLPEISKNIIEQICDEAHRFAVSYHRKLRRRSIKETD